MTRYSHSILIATPKIDPIFSGSLVYINQDEHLGSIGLIINKPIQLEKRIVTDHLKLQHDIPILLGGPVSPNTIFMIEKQDNNQINILTQKAFSEIKTFCKDDYQMIMGLSGWSSNQLHEEIDQGQWIVIPASNEIIFHQDIKKRYTIALSSINIKPHQLSAQYGHA